MDRIVCSECGELIEAGTASTPCPRCGGWRRMVHADPERGLAHAELGELEALVQQAVAQLADMPASQTAAGHALMLSRLVQHPVLGPVFLDALESLSPVAVRLALSKILSLISARRIQAERSVAMLGPDVHPQGDQPKPRA
jgi:hypothetical protein